MSVELNAGDAIQIGVGVVLTGTLLAVLYYACQAKRQADANARMAREMEQARHDAARPVINIDFEPYERDSDAGLKQALGKAFPAAIQCQLRNIGVGPALNVRFQVDDGQGGSYLLQIGALEAGEADKVQQHLTVVGSTVEQERKLLQVFYEDVFGNTVESRRDLSLSEDGGLVVGPLRILVSGDTTR